MNMYIHVHVLTVNLCIYRSILNVNAHVLKYMVYTSYMYMYVINVYMMLYS